MVILARRKHLKLQRRAHAHHSHRFALGFRIRWLSYGAGTRLLRRRRYQLNFVDRNNPATAKSHLSVPFLKQPDSRLSSSRGVILTVERLYLLLYPPSNLRPGPQKHSAAAVLPFVIIARRLRTRQGMGPITANMGRKHTTLTQNQYTGLRLRGAFKLHDFDLLHLKPAALTFAASGGELRLINHPLLAATATWDKQDCFGDFEHLAALIAVNFWLASSKTMVKMLPFRSAEGRVVSSFS